VREAETLPAGRTPIYVGESKATRMMGLISYQFQLQESLVLVTKDSVVLIGRDDPDTGPITYEKDGVWPGFRLRSVYYRLGTLYAAYDFLETYCGVRWYMVTDVGRVVPKLKTLALSPDRRRFKPWTSLRQIGWGTWGTPGDLGKVDLYGKRRYKRWAPRRELNLHRLRMRGACEPFGVNHSVHDYSKRFGKEHPDWFVDDNPGPGMQLRYDKPEVIKQVAADAMDYFALPFELRRFGAKMTHASRLGAGDFFPVMPLDNRHYGEKTNPPLQLERRGRGFGTGTYSNYVFTWVNNVAKLVAAKYPGGCISTCAYAGMFEPPEFDMEPNVAVCVCMADGWREGGYGLEMLHAWRERVSRLYTWEYYYANRRFPIIRPRLVAHYITKQLYPMRVEGMFMEIGDESPVLYHLDYYVTMRLLYDGRQDVEKILAEYFQLFYGPAAAPMTRFWNMLEEMTAKTRGAPRSRTWIVAAADGRLEALENSLAEAERIAKEEPYAARVRLLRVAGLDMIMERTKFNREVAAAGRPNLKVPAAAKPPAVDGKLDDAAWKGAAATPPFVTMLNKPQDVKTIGLVTRDDKCLYIAFRCEEPSMDKLNLHQTRTSSAICTDDSIEINVDMDPETEDYLQVMVNANGLTWWWWRKKHAPQELPDLGIQAAAAKGQKEWTVEVAIPFAKITGQPPKAGQTWGLNVMRNRIGKGQGFKRFDERKWACWSPPFALSWHIRERFGTVTFTE